jgi:hypothetical protein
MFFNLFNKRKSQSDSGLSQDDKAKVVTAVADSLAQAFDDHQKLPHQYVVKYLRVSDDSLIGYHASTFCQLTDDVYSAKRYSGDNPYDQLQTVFKNFTSVVNTKDTDDGLFAPLRLQVKNTYFPGLTPDDVYLDAEYLDEDAPAQSLKVTVNL